MKRQSGEGIEDAREDFQTLGSAEAREKVFKHYDCTEEWAVFVDVVIDEFPDHVAKNGFFDGWRISKQNITQYIGTFVNRLFSVGFLDWLGAFKNKTVINDVEDVVG